MNFTPRLNSFSGMNITFSDHALEETQVRLFPESRHRSKRIHKKLVARYGGEFETVPCMFKTPNGILAHPSFRAQLMALSN